MPEPPVSLPEKPKLASALLVRPEGPESIEVFGAVVSTVQLLLAGRLVHIPGLVDRPDFDCVAAVGKPE